MKSHKRRTQVRNNIRFQKVELRGGLNLVDAPMSIPSGMLTDATNYECLPRGGYRRIDGFERYSGLESPSDASYWVISFTGGSGTMAEGDSVTSSGGGVGELLINANGASGSIVITNYTGSISSGDTLTFQSGGAATASGAPVRRGASTNILDSTHAQDAIETQRVKIQAVGDVNSVGGVRGIHIYNGEVFAFRDNATNCEMWKASATGWVKQSLGDTLSFTLGTSEVFEGETITQGGATATVERVSFSSGDWASGNDAAGHFVLSGYSGTFTAGVVTSSGGGSFTLAGDAVPTTLSKGGRFEFVNHNFYANPDSYRMYGCDGVNRAFEWDGVVFTPIATGNTIDAPTHIAAHKALLWLSFNGGSLQYSEAGTPLQWATGGEIGAGDRIVALQPEIGDVLSVITRNRLLGFYGSPYEAGSTLKTISDESGGIEWTAQRIGSLKYLDDRGLTTMASVQAFGDFYSSVFSQLIEPILTKKKLLAVSSTINKTKNQYRIFFSDGTGVIATYNGNKLSGFTTMNYYNNAVGTGESLPVSVVTNGENTNGEEVIYFGSTDGFVYQMDKGSSNDGGALSSSIRLAFDSFGSTVKNKQYKKVLIEADGAKGLKLDYAAEFDYGSGQSPATNTHTYDVSSGGGVWGDSLWDSFLWSSSSIAQIEGDLTGLGRSISLTINSTHTYIEPHTLYGLTYQYLPRKVVR